MKKKIIIFTVLGFIGMTSWYCTDKINTDVTGKATLKESLNSGAADLNTAVTAISQSNGYQVLTMENQGTLKSALADMSFSDSILLDSIKGVYEFQKVTSNNWCRFCFNKLFKKTGDDSQLVIKLPEALAFHPSRLRNVINDTTLTNNFVITVPEYRYVYTMGFLYDYNVSAGIAVNDTSLGDFSIQSSKNDSSFNYQASYSFANGYQLAVSAVSGDTVKRSFAIMKGDSVLFKESNQVYKTPDSRFRERAYQLTIGNVEIQRISGSDSIAVYVDNVLQQNAKIEFTDSSDSSGDYTICHRTRDIQITFDDGTTTTLSALIGPSLDTLKNMQSYLLNVSFASNLVDYIAWGIHYNRIY